MPSAMLIPANTLTWIQFVFETSAGSLRNSVLAQLEVYVSSGYTEMNVTIGMYGPDGNLMSADSYVPPLSNCHIAPCEALGNASITPNQVMSMQNFTGQASESFPVDPANVTLPQGSVFYVAFVANQSIWVGGFSAPDRSGGTGLQYGQFPWEAPATYEGPMGQQQNATLPNSLPAPALTTSFETCIGGDVEIPSA
jgi:hypothetical protein